MYSEMRIAFCAMLIGCMPFILLEFAENEIDCIAGELNMVKEINCDSLLQALEHIAMQNKDMEHWKDKNKRKCSI